MGIPAKAHVLPFDSESRAFERRRHRRGSVPHIRAQPASGKLEIVNMCQQGMAIKTHHPFSIGGNYLFELFDSGRSVMLEGEIRWCERVPHQPPAVDDIRGSTRFQTGVSFVGIFSRSREDRDRQVPQTRLPDRSSLKPEELTTDRIRRLRGASSPDQAAELLLDLLSVDFEHLVLFRIQDEEIRAWMGRGPTLVPERLIRLRLGLDQVAIFLHLKAGGSFYYGMLPAMLAHLQLLHCWQGNLERECVLFPIRIRERMVAVLYADTGRNCLSPDHLGGLKTVTDLFTRSLIDQILSRKNLRTAVDAS